jgi:hypothetical protein
MGGFERSVREECERRVSVRGGGGAQNGRIFTHYVTVVSQSLISHGRHRMLACERKFEEEVVEWEGRLKAADAQWAARVAEVEQQAGECVSVTGLV